MLSPLPRLRQIATLAALIGCLLAVAPTRQAGAAGCHVSDRPIFGLSIEEDRPAIPSIEPLTDDEPEPVRVDRRCQSDDPDRPPSRTLLPGDRPLSPLTEETTTHGGPVSRLGLDDDGLHPLLTPSRIDRPPQRF